MARPARTKPNLREAQKQATIAQLRDAARWLFYEEGFDGVSIDRIVGAIGASRATFYLYFPSKRDILMSVLLDDMAEQMKVYERLARIEELNWPAVRAWLDDYRAEMDERRQSLRLFPVAFGGHVEDHPLTIAHHEEAIRKIGVRFPAFDLETGSEAAKAHKRVQAYMIIFELEQVTVRFSNGPGTPDLKIGFDILADRMLALLQSEETVPSV